MRLLLIPKGYCLTPDDSSLNFDFMNTKAVSFKGMSFDWSTLGPNLNFSQLARRTKFKTKPEPNVDQSKVISMTTLLTHTVAHSTKPSFRSKTNNQPLKKFLSLALS